ncbi:hypothetical protein WJX74_006650 [Apatococcus lobatus]|uniref:Uncharacterized protein n=1 Tax=Apatococcus lobatus TaxID=904363 RepID=A0AAW1S3L7_9CHLO
MVPIPTHQQTFHRTHVDGPDKAVPDLADETPRNRRSHPLQIHDLCLDAAGFAGCVFDSADVTIFFTMCSEALSAKTAASEVLQERVDKASESMQEQEVKVAQALEKGAAMSEDTCFLEKQLEAVIKERSTAKEKAASLEREREYLLEERIILRRQLDSHEASSEAHEPWLTQMLEGRLEEEHQRRAQAEMELDREHAEVETLRQVIMDLESKHVARRTEWQEREASLMRCLEVADLASSCDQRKTSTTSAFVAGLLSGVKSGIKPASASMLRSASSPLQEEATPRHVEYISGTHLLAHEAAENITDDDSCRMRVKRWRRELPLGRSGSATTRRNTSDPKGHAQLAQAW